MAISTIGQNGLNAPLSLTSPTIATPTFTGQATIPTINLTGGQITFPATQSASTNANTLDDYEEGTWTPNVGGTATYQAQTGEYIKIGRFVYATFDMIINQIGTGSTTGISGLPFAAGGSSQGQAGSVGYFASLPNGVYYIALRLDLNSTTIATAATQGIQTTITNGLTIFANSARLIGSIYYCASA